MINNVAAFCLGGFLTGCIASAYSLTANGQLLLFVTDGTVFCGVGLLIVWAMKRK